MNERDLENANSLEMKIYFKHVNSTDDFTFFFTQHVTDTFSRRDLLFFFALSELSDYIKSQKSTFTNQAPQLTPFPIQIAEFFNLNPKISAYFSTQIIREACLLSYTKDQRRFHFKHFI